MTWHVLQLLDHLVYKIFLYVIVLYLSENFDLWLKCLIMGSYLVTHYMFDKMSKGRKMGHNLQEHSVG